MMVSDAELATANRGSAVSRLSVVWSNALNLVLFQSLCIRVCNSHRGDK